jgi:hypothetical protein
LELAAGPNFRGRWAADFWVALAVLGLAMSRHSDVPTAGQFERGVLGGRDGHAAEAAGEAIDASSASPARYQILAS